MWCLLGVPSELMAEGGASSAAQARPQWKRVVQEPRTCYLDTYKCYKRHVYPSTNLPCSQFWACASWPAKVNEYAIRDYSFMYLTECGLCATHNCGWVWDSLLMHQGCIFPCAWVLCLQWLAQYLCASPTAMTCSW